MSDTKVRLRQILVQALRLDVAPEALPETNLASELGLDSINSLEFLIWVENSFEIQIEDSALSVALIDSLETLATYVDRKVVEAQVANPVQAAQVNPSVRGETT